MEELTGTLEEERKLKVKQLYLVDFHVPLPHLISLPFLHFPALEPLELQVEINRKT